MTTFSAVDLNSLLVGRKATIVHIGWPVIRLRLKDGSMLEFHGIRDEMHIVLVQEDKIMYHEDRGVE